MAYARLLGALCVLLALSTSHQHVPTESELHTKLINELRLRSSKEVWKNESPPTQREVDALRQQTWKMFDFGFKNYMEHAFPQDNLLPISCAGQNWQGGMALTLVDALDALMLMNRKADIAEAVKLLRRHIKFDIDARVHVFETTIRVLGGLLSGHVLLLRSPHVLPDYDGTLLTQAVDLATRMLPAFDTQSGLPSLWVNLAKGQSKADTNVTCTACAGTLLLEFGVLSALTGNRTFIDKARHAAELMYEQRSKLGLVGSSYDVHGRTWVAKDSTIGPGTDSYYEYLLKAYLMFGDPAHLDMFCELYASTMRYLQVPGTVKGYSFLVDVHMDSGRLIRPWVSSLGAFWPGMQALVGQDQDAVELHANFTAVWQAYGWLPEAYSIDTARINPEDPGYNLRPEHVESTYLLHAATGNPVYLKTARSLLHVLEHNRVKCGYAKTGNVQKGDLGDLQESFFLSETVKYLYLAFSDASHLVDYYVLTTEGHLLPAFEWEGLGELMQGEGEQEGGQEQQQQHGQEQQHDSAAAEGSGSGEGSAHDASEASSRGSCATGGGESCSSDAIDEASAAEGPSSSTTTSGTRTTSSTFRKVKAKPRQRRGPAMPDEIPEPCRKLCDFPDARAQAQREARLRAAFPLLSFNPLDGDLLRRRRCIACAAVAHRMATSPTPEPVVRARLMNLNVDNLPPVEEPAAEKSVLAQVMCPVYFDALGRPKCATTRVLTPTDMQVGLPANSVLLQLSQIKQQLGPATSLWLLANSPGRQQEELEASPAHFGPPPPNTTSACLTELYSTPVPPGSPTTSPPDRFDEYSVPQSTCAAQAAENATAWQRTAHQRQTIERCGPGQPVVGQLLEAEPLAACEELSNAAQLRGKIAVVLRGNCSFIAKVMNAEAAGAIGVVVVNNRGNNELIRMAGDDHMVQQPTVPSVLVTRETGQRLLAWMGQQEVTVGMLGTHVLLPGKDNTSASTRLDMLIPVSSNGWLNLNVFSKGLDANGLFESLLAEPYVLQSLWVAAAKKGT